MSSDGASISFGKTFIMYRKRRYSASTALACFSVQPSPDSLCINLTLIGSRSNSTIDLHSLYEFMVHSSSFGVFLQVYSGLGRINWLSILRPPMVGLFR